MNTFRPMLCVTGIGMLLSMSSLAASSSINQVEASRDFRADHPRARMASDGFGVKKIVDQAIATGSTAKAAAVAAKDTIAPMLGVDPDDFIEVGPFPNGQHELGLMYRPETGDYKFTAYYWTQTAGGIPVWRSRLMALVRNDTGFPVVQVTSDVRDVSGFSAPHRAVANHGLAIVAAAAKFGGDVAISEPEVVVFAGIDDMRFAPRAAMVFEATLGEAWEPDTYQKELLVVDLETGAVLHEENRILHATNGTVSGLATDGSGADECHAEVSMPLPYAKLTRSGNTAYADANGNFSIGGSGNITSKIEGTWFNVNNNSGSDGSLTQGDSNPNFVHNSANSDAKLRAQVNAYVESNTVRDYTLAYAPSFPVIGSQNSFTVNTGVSGTCNAYYDYSSINFYNAGGGCNNTAFSVIVHHEYGHHLVSSAGSGQGAYGEGMGDVMGVLITGDNQLARGFYQGNCSSGIRNADNTKQYPCSGGIHDCGQLISGCVWDALELLPESVVAELAINSMPLHSGDGIDPTITLDWLTLDDDDGNLDNGTPHSTEILAAFALHNMDSIPEPLDNDFCSTAREITWGSWDVNTIGALSDGDPYDDAQCGGTYLGEMNADVWYHLTACGSGTMSVSTCDTVDFDSDIVVYRGDSCGTLSQIGCNGDGSNCGGYSSYTTVSVTEGDSYYIRVGGWSGSSSGTGLLVVDGPGDPCDSSEPCTGDMDGSGDVGADDLLAVIAGWGSPSGDVDGNGTTDSNDLLLLIASWGSCP
ncbi:MAG: hypothetical protein QGG74_05695 [Phycisphaerales bacterium]|nr:hypothetical protein [Phycisphaerales bacterium]